jgi:hypothetical protein
VIALVAVVAVLVAACAAAGWYDVRERRRGAVLRRPGDVLTEAAHSRIDMDAVAYEPVRQPGQRDWATYRRRDARP